MKEKKILFGTGGFSILAFIAALEETDHVLCGTTQTSRLKFSLALVCILQVNTACVDFCVQLLVADLDLQFCLVSLNPGKLPGLWWQMEETVRPGSLCHWVQGLIVPFLLELVGDLLGRSPYIPYPAHLSFVVRSRRKVFVTEVAGEGSLLLKFFSISPPVVMERNDNVLQEMAKYKSNKIN